MKKLKSTLNRIEDFWDYLWEDKNGNLIMGLICIAIPVVLYFIFGLEYYTEDAPLFTIEGLINIPCLTVAGMFMFGVILVIRRICQRFLKYLGTDSISQQL